MNAKGMLFVSVGIPGCGKSTYGERFKRELNGNVCIVCPDSVREHLYGDASIQGDGEKVFSIVYDLAENALERGETVYFDATNTTVFSRRRLLQRLSCYAGECVAVYFNVPLEVCKRRNAQRSRVVPDSVIDRMHNKLTKPTKNEGFSCVLEVGE